jgi:hypothetical protein
MLKIKAMIFKIFIFGILSQIACNKLKLLAFKMSVFQRISREKKRRREEEKKRRREEEKKRESRCHSRSVYTLFLAASESGSDLSRYAGKMYEIPTFLSRLIAKI